ncbi:MAG TPA: methylenetetrahydrofolate--tRNA-(uracil(54)-C(5))-methyltransferase (FADH(2)-oxidizing) TrmFO, partial [Thermotoga naphthophila]|nr:methylenetetrahydrofolate--tRNA-(uracil(54)-C(5))-methyltransferase (FADH(2)-oxidizing) TrmFO [Thermotoga petrophila]
LGDDFLFFFDAVSPIVTFESIDMERAFWGDRFGKGKDYINCPLTKEEYEEFWKALVEAEVIEMEDFDRKLLFERCQPIEEIARSGKDALRYGPLRPTGLVDPRTGKEPYAVIQLRREDKEGRFYSLVGFQTRLKWSEQKRVLRKIPCLRNAEIVRYGVMHRNVYINSPKLLDIFFRLKKHPNIFFAGQITGVEGYMESAASGIYVAYNVHRILKGLSPLKLPEETMMGALFSYIIEKVEGDLKPMYANFGLLPPLKVRVKDKFEKRKKLAERAIETMKKFLEENPW